MQKYKNTARLLRYNDHKCYVSNINAVFRSFCCPNCYTFFKRTLNMQWLLTICSERAKKFYPRSVYETVETLLDKLDSFAIKYTNEQRLSKKKSSIGFRSFCFQEETFEDTNGATWIRKYVPISVSISSKNHNEPFLTCKSDRDHLVASFIRRLENSASQSRQKTKHLLLDIETSIKIDVDSIMEKLTQRCNRR